MISAQGAATIALAVTACAFDCRSAKLPNALTLAGAAAGVAFNLATGGWSQAAWSVAGATAGIAVFFPFFAVGGLGAGDVKLLAALGAWLGPAAAVWTGLYGAVAGGVLAVGVALHRRYAREAFRNLAALLQSWRATGLRPVDGLTLKTSKGPRLPYALPITAGLFLTLWLR